MVSLNDEKFSGVQNITSQNVSNPETLVIEREDFETVRKQVKANAYKIRAGCILFVSERISLF